MIKNQHQFKTGLKSPVRQFENKLLSKPLFSSKFDFCIFEHKNCDVIENSPKAPLNLSPLNAHIWANIHLNIISACVRKNEIEKWPLRTSFQCSIYSRNVFIQSLHFRFRVQTF